MDQAPLSPGERPSPAGAAPAEHPDAVDIGRLARTLWGYRRVIGLAFAGVIVGYGLYLLASLVLAPVTQRGSVAFRLNLTGQRYPDGSVFRHEEIIAIPVLQQVYNANQLERYMDFSRFRDGLLIEKSSARLEMLASQYRARLAEPRLTATERARIEQEFNNRREQLLLEHSYVLVLTRTSRWNEMPRLLVNKVLVDVLSEWARQAAERKGVLRANIVHIASTRFRDEFSRADEPIVATDMVRMRAQRLLESIDSLRAVTGALAARGDKGESIAGTRAQIDDTLALLVRPALVRMQSLGIGTSAQNVRAYAEARLLEVASQHDEVARRVAALQASMANFGFERGTAPAGTQVPASPAAPETAAGDATRTGAAAAAGAGSFFDAVALLTTRQQDAVFRQRLVTRLQAEHEQLAALTVEKRYYEGFVASMRDVAAFTGAEVPAQVRSDIDRAIERLQAALDTASKLHGQLIERNLAASSALYSLSEPFILTSTDGLSGTRFGLNLALLLVLAAVLVPASCLLHAAVSSGSDQR